jgi:hypothetical protein
MTGFIAYVSLYPRVSLKGAFEVLEPDDGKLSRPGRAPAMWFGHSIGSRSRGGRGPMEIECRRKRGAADGGAVSWCA